MTSKEALDILNKNGTGRTYSEQEAKALLELCN